MYCINCGTQIPDGSRFCTNCGARVSEPLVSEPVQKVEETVIPEAAAAAPEAFAQPVEEQQVPPVEEQVPPVEEQIPPAGQQIPPMNQQVPPKKKKKTGLLIGIIGGAVALIAIVLVLLLVVFPIGKPRIDLAKYVQVEFSGFDGGGKATAVFDREEFLEDYSGRIKYAKGYESFSFGGIAPEEDLADYYIDYYISSEESGLKNGDEVTCFITVSPMVTEIYNISLKNEKKIVEEGGIEVPFTVEGLEEAELYDAFEGIKISYTGVEPYGELEIDWSECPEPTRTYSYLFEADKEYDLKNGDKITISIDDDDVADYIYADYAMAPSSTSYTFTVEDLPVLLTSLSQIDATSLSEFEEDCKEIIDMDYIGSHSENISTSSYHIIGYILKVAKEPSEFSDNNRLYAVYEMNNMVANSQPYTVYAVYSYTNVGVDDGKLSYNVYQFYDEAHTIEITLGNWIVTDYYGFTSVAELKEYLINNEDADYTYETNLP